MAADVVAVLAKRSTLERRQGLHIALYATPATLLMLSVFVVPMGIVVAQSLTSGQAATFSFSAFTRIASDPLFLEGWRHDKCSRSRCWQRASPCYLPIRWRSICRSSHRAVVHCWMQVLVLVPFWTSVLVKSFAFISVILGSFGPPYQHRAGVARATDRQTPVQSRRRRHRNEPLFGALHGVPDPQ